MTDTLTPKQRSYCMSRIKGKDTSIEKLVRTELRRRGVRFSTNVRSLPGKPDVVFKKQNVAVFIDGDFWHGYRLPAWKDTLPSYWLKKIECNRLRDKRNFRKLRDMGWTVIRIWEHQLKTNLQFYVRRVLKSLGGK